MLYAIHTAELGKVMLHTKTMSFHDKNIHITGYDDDDNQISFVLDKICYLEDYFSSDYGYCHIVSYTKDGVCTKCNMYQSLS